MGSPLAVAEFPDPLGVEPHPPFHAVLLEACRTGQLPGPRPQALSVSSAARVRVLAAEDQQALEPLFADEQVVAAMAMGDSRLVCLVHKSRWQLRLHLLGSDTGFDLFCNDCYDEYIGSLRVKSASCGRLSSSFATSFASPAKIAKSRTLSPLKTKMKMKTRNRRKSRSH